MVLTNSKILFKKSKSIKMKTALSILFTLFVALTINAQEVPQKIIFDVTSSDAKVHKSVMLMMNVMSAEFPKSTFEVVVYGKALPMLIKGQSVVANDVAQYEENDNVLFTACEVSMKLLFNIDETQLLGGVGTVENAIPDIVKKQKSGWGYIKTGN